MGILLNRDKDLERILSFELSSLIGTPHLNWEKRYATEVSQLSSFHCNSNHFPTWNSSKLNKMHIQCGKDWSQLLKSAVLCMNSTFKKSPGSTPFRIMWGRDCRYEELVPSNSSVSVSAEEDVDEEEDILSLCDFLGEKDEEDIFSFPIEHPDDSIAEVKEFRDTTWKIAGEDIITEQMKQKTQYDKKVTQNRFVSKHYLLLFL